MNLRIAADRLTSIAKKEAAEAGATGVSVALAVITAGDAMLKEDIAANKVGTCPFRFGTSASPACF